MPFQSRQELAQALSDRMARTYENLAETQELEVETSLVKSYLLEAHTHENSPHDVLETVFGRPLGQAGTPEVSQTEDDSLGVVEATVGSEQVSIYIDYSDPRFWIAHSMSGSNALDYCIDRAVRRSHALDRAWLPADLLSSTANLGSLRGLGLDYDRRKLADVDLEGGDAPVAFLKMQLWGNPADEVLQLLSDNFPNETTLAKIKVKAWLQDVGPDGPFSIDDLKFDGKVTARGNSFDSHTSFVTTVYRKYAEEISRIESDYALRSTMEDEDRLAFYGSPISFHFDRGIPNLRRFADLLFSSSEPFRLWGMPIDPTESFARIEAVDLHVGCSFTAELSNEWMRLYIPEGTCGNTVLRIYTNLQHYYDSQVRVVDQDGEPFFAFQLAAT